MNTDRMGWDAWSRNSTVAIDMGPPRPNPFIASTRTMSMNGPNSFGRDVLNSSRVVAIKGKVDLMVNRRRSRTRGTSQRSNSLNSGSSIRSPGKDVCRRSKGSPSKGLKRVRKYNCILCVVLLAFSLLFIIIGGVVVGMTGRRYSMRRQREDLSIRNSMTLNNSVSTFHDFQNDLIMDTSSLLHMVDRIGIQFTTPAEMLKAYNDTFFTYSTIALGTSQSDVFTIYVPFCNQENVENGDCTNMMLLSYKCEPLNGGRRRCYYSTSDLPNVITYEVNKNDRGFVTGMKLMDTRKLVTKAVNLTGLQNGEGNRFLESDVFSSYGNKFSTLTFQNVVVKAGRVIVCEASSYTSNWPWPFDKKSSSMGRSYAMIFDSYASILAYSYEDGPGAEMRLCRGTYPKAMGLVAATSLENCEPNSQEVVDGMVKFLLNSKHLGTPSSPLPKIGDTIVVDYNDHVVAAQTILYFWSNRSKPQTIFTAYASPVIADLDKGNIIQIVICVAVIVTSSFVLAGVSICYVSQLQKTLELVSVLAVNVATYDLEKMGEILDRDQPECSRCFGFLRGNLLKDEFSKILFNLKAYRPFLPQALLTSLSHTPRNSFPRESALLQYPIPGDENLSRYCNLRGSFLRPPQFSLAESRRSEYDEGVIDSPGNEIVSRPLQRLRSVKGTVIVIQLLDCILEEARSVALINHFLGFVLQYVRINGGVADHIGADQVIATFNFHMPVVRHQQKACQCAMSIQEECRKAELRVVIAITSGANYVCTVGTDEQKARVVAGDSVDFAKRLVTLNNYLDVSILVTQQVAHASGVVAVPVDNVEVYSPHHKTMTQHLVLEMVSLHNKQLSKEQRLTKEVLQLILSRNRDGALDVIDDFMRNFSGSMEVPWQAQRLHELCIRNATLIYDGYCRPALDWAPLEGDMWLERGDRSYHHHRNSFSSALDDSETYRGHDVERAKKKIGELSQSGKRNVLMKTISQGEDSLISVFLNDEDAELDSTEIKDSHELRSVNDSFSRPYLPRCVEDINQQIFYRTDELLGKGRFGRVYLAISSTGSFVATKVFPLEGNEAALVREVEALIQLRHEHILTYDTCAVQDGFFFLFTEYMAAGNMRRLISLLGQVPEEAARKYSRDILYGLQFLHSMEYVHCDLKPDNVLLTSEGTCKLGDFGTVRLARSVTDKVGALRGTPRYMAPEAVLGDWTVKADIYSFGLTLAHMLLGCSPWSHYLEPDDHFLVRLAQNKGEMKPELPVGLKDGELERAVHRCCEFDPVKRPTVDELLTMLS